MSQDRANQDDGGDVAWIRTGDRGRRAEGPIRIAGALSGAGLAALVWYQGWTVALCILAGAVLGALSAPGWAALLTAQPDYAEVWAALTRRRRR